MALGVIAQIQTPYVTISRTTAIIAVVQIVVWIIQTTICSKLQIKRIHNTHTSVAHSAIQINHWYYTKRHPRPFVMILWTSSFTPKLMKILILLANSHCPFTKVKRFLARQTKTLNGRFPILTTLPASKLIDCYSYDPIVHGAKS